MSLLDYVKAAAWFATMAGCFTGAAFGIYLFWRILRDCTPAWKEMREYRESGER